MKNVLIIDHSTIKGHHALYITGVIEALKNDSYELFVCTADNKNFKSLVKDKTSLTWLDLPTTFFIRLLASMFKLLKTRSLSKLILVFQVREMIKRYGHDIVFFPHLDSVISSTLPTWVYGFISTPWSGIFIHPFEKPGDEKWTYLNRLSKLDSIQKILILDELLYKGLTESDKLAHIPELTLALEVNQPYYDELAKKKTGRKSISLIGSSVRRKKLIDFLNLCDQLDPTSYYVLIEGYFPAEQYSDSDKRHIGQKIDSLRAKKMLHHVTDYIKDEATFNALYQASDVIWLNYEDHPFTSNALIKAMHFGVRVISNQQCDFIQHIIKKYNYPVLNEPLSPDGIHRLLSCEIDQEKQERFKNDFSYGRFKEIIRQSVLTNNDR